MLTADRSKGTIVVVDDTDVIAEVLCRHLVSDGYTVDVAHNGVSGLDLIRRVSPDLVLLDVMMPGMNGYEVCRRLKSNPQTWLTPVVLITTLDARDDRIEGVDAGADDFLTKPIDLGQLRARVRALLRVKHITDDLDSAEEVILNLGRAVEARDRYTEGHCERLATYAAGMGAELQLSPAEMQVLYRGALLHDIGKIAVPDAILLKPGRLTAAEFTAMQCHTTVGEMLCADFRALRLVRPIVRSHHERLDGSGYPDGLKGDAIPLLAQIIGVVDVFDAMTTSRSYKPALSFPAAGEVLREEASRGLHQRALVDVLTTLYTGSPFEPDDRPGQHLPQFLGGVLPCPRDVH